MGSDELYLIHSKRYHKGTPLTQTPKQNLPVCHCLIPSLIAFFFFCGRMTKGTNGPLAKM